MSRAGNGKGMALRQNFSFATAGQIIFGAGRLAEIGPEAARYGKKALVTTGQRGLDVPRLCELLAASGVSCTIFAVTGEPTVDMVLQAVEAARTAGCEMVIGFGGGSALDAGKAAAALLTNPGDPLDYLEVVGKNLPLREPPAPYFAVPTTAGTGSEVTRNAVISVPEKQVKVSLRSPMMLARLALVDPELTYNLPPEITAATGMDALAQLIEPYVSRRANPLTDLYCREGIRIASQALRKAYHNGQDTAARVDMAYASLLGGLSLANAGLGAVHGIAGPVGGMFAAPHGVVCAALLPAVVAVNARALAERDPHGPALARYTEVACLVTGSQQAEIADLVRWLGDLRAELRIPGLRAFGVQPGEIPILVEKTAAASSTKANPVTLTAEELTTVLEMAA